MNENYLSVSQVSNYIKNIFDAEVLLQGICVYGEISSYNISGGNAYFTLKDEKSLLNCVMFGADKDTSPAIGDVVLAFGSMQYYAKGGKLTFNVGRIEPYGKGLLYEQFLQLKQKLGDLGYFDEAHKKAVPQYVRRIGVVTSETGAVFQDIRDVTHRRNNGIDIILYPVKVQGVGSENEIAKGISFFSDYEGVDCVIVARGGGSVEDLQAFNTEIVATAAYNCKKPLVSAVGHETDFTIIDFVSDLRAPTPSAAAELVAWKKEDIINNLYGYIEYISDRVLNLQLQKSGDVQHFFTKLQLLAEKRVNSAQRSFTLLLNNMSTAIENSLTVTEKQMIKIDKTIDSLNPTSVLKRGYAIITNQYDEKVATINGLFMNEDVTITMKDGSARAKVNDIKIKEEDK